MDRPLELLLTTLDKNRTALWEAVEHVPPSLRAVRPAPDRWSVTDVLEHLVLIERRITALMEQRFATAPRRTGAAADIDSLGALIDVDRLLDRNRQITTGDSTQPRGGLDEASARDALTTLRCDLRRVVESGDGLALETIAVPHPVFGTFNLYQWIAFVAVHEARHTAQIREIGGWLMAGNRR